MEQSGKPTFTAASLIRRRRIQRGLSLSQLADLTGTGKSYLSMIESGTRVPSDAQIASLAHALELPAELVRVAAGRFPSDVESRLGSQVALLTAASRQKEEQNASSFIGTLSDEMLALIKSRTGPATPGLGTFSGDLTSGKNTTSYRTHSYHTKVPPEVIVPLIERFTEPGQVVLDPFSGSGMTGVAALRTGRHVVLSDLSPAAVHISRNYVTPCQPEALEAAFKRVMDEVWPTMAWLYDVVDRTAGRRTVEYTTWSDVFQCPRCQAQWPYWDVARSEEDVVDPQCLVCPACKATVHKRDLAWVREVPVESTTSSDSGRRLDRHAPTEAERALISQAEDAPIPYWIPQVEFGREREMWRASHTAMGIKSVAGFYTRRNLHALAALRHSILSEPDGRLRDALLFAFTAMVNRASRRYQWNAKRPTNVMTGTLYISSLRYEWNVWSLFRRKVSDAVRYYRHFPAVRSLAQVVHADATNLQFVPDGSVDFVFMDPPFGANIFYADSSLLWEAWLGRLMDEGREIVVNKHRRPETGGKTLADYQSLLTRAFAEVRRVLRSGATAVLAFSNTDERVWEAVQSAVRDAGLEVNSSHLLDKVQRSIKGVKGTKGEERVTSVDVLLCLRARVGKASTPAEQAPSGDAETSIIRSLKESGTRGLRTDEVYSRLIKELVGKERSVKGVSLEAVEELCRNVGATCTAGRWTLLERSEKLQYQKLHSPFTPVLASYVGDTSRVLSGTRENASRVQEPPALSRVEGSRGGPFYNAHSYQTKVPPEAIVPFLEHFTEPGDLVLDPFCGSGMTGVAAALCGRKAILNDLSVTAAHLSFNHTQPCDGETLVAEFERIYKTLQPSFAELYSIRHGRTRRGYVHYTIWSRRYRCTACRKPFLFWDAIDRKTGKVGKSIRCPKCSASIKRHSLVQEDSQPAWVSYEVPERGKTVRIERRLTQAEQVQFQGYEREKVKEWYPRLSLGPDREMYIRCALHLQGIQEVADFYTPRNLEALGRLWKAIQEVEDQRLRQALTFAFTNTAWHGTRMRRFNARGGQRPLTGTLYIPQLSSEVNVLEVMRNKVQQLKAYYDAYKPASALPPPVVTLGSATALRSIPDASVDYVFTDPPFGSNIFYSDCNVILESWLGTVTNPAEEAVVNRSLPAKRGGKTLLDYESLMTRALCEIHRVLKRGGWATMVFHNTDSEVWQAIQRSAAAARLELVDATTLDRKQRSHKGYKGRDGSENVAHYDVVMHLRKSERATQARKVADDKHLAPLVSRLCSSREARAKGIQWVHSALMKTLVADGFDLGSIDYERVKALCGELLQADMASID